MKPRNTRPESRNTMDSFVARALHKKVNLQNLHKILLELDKRWKENPKGVMLAGKVYMGNILLGRKTASFLMPFIKAERGELPSLVEAGIRKISEEKDVPLEKAADVFIGEMQELMKKLRMRLDRTIKRVAWLPDVPSGDLKKARNVSHYLLKDFGSYIYYALERVERAAKKYKEKAK